MRFLRRGPGIDRATAETLLNRRYATSDGGVAGARRRTLEAYLAAAAASARPHEVAGEQATLAAFRAAGLRCPAPTGATSRLRAAAGRIAVVPTAAVVALTAGGVALAAVTGAVPSPRLWLPTTSSSSVAPGGVDRPNCGSTDTVPMAVTEPTPAPPVVTADPSQTTRVPDATPSPRTDGEPQAAGPPHPDHDLNTPHQPPAPPTKPPAHKPPTPPGPTPPAHTPPAAKPPAHKPPTPNAHQPSPPARISPPTVSAARHGTPAAVSGADTRRGSAGTGNTGGAHPLQTTQSGPA
jgi:hypothetical protein